ncbi:MAG: protein kinase, partial [Leptospiraceae bacterium]|nr:protein kinase [Leptospiraceae bacterium]
MKLDGYTNIEKIYEGEGTIIFRAKDESSESVILKGLKSEYPSSKETQKLKKEFEILQKLNHKNIIKGLGFKKLNQRLFL